MSNPELLTACWEAVSENMLLERLFFSSVEFIALTCIVTLLAWKLKQRSPRLVALLWMVVMLNAVVELSIGAPFSVGLFKEPTLDVEVATTTPADTIVVTPMLAEPAADSASGTSQAPYTLPESLRSEAKKKAFSPQTRTASPSPAPVMTKKPWHSVMPYALSFMLASMWGIGVLIGCIGAALDRFRLFRLLRGTTQPSDEILRAYGKEARAMGLRKTPRLRLTTALESPAIAGVLRPHVLLPTWMAEGLDARHLGWALRHELCHWKARDPIANTLCQVARILFFFNPALWWASRRWKEAVELACDRALVHSEEDVIEYVEGLYAMLCEIRSRRHLSLSCGLFATRTQLGSRIATLVGNPLRFSGRLTRSGIAIVVAFALLSLGLGARFTTSAQAQEGNPAEQGEANAPLDNAAGFAEAGDATEALMISEEPPPARTVQFPEDRSMGQVLTRTWGSHYTERWTPLQSAQGTVNIPEGQEVRLQVDASAAADLSPLSALGEQDLQSIYMRSLPVQSEQLQHIEGMALRELNLERTEIDNEAFDHIDDMTTLEYLSVGRTQVDHQEIHRLGELTELRFLDLNLTGVDDAGLSQLGNLSNLENLDLWEGNVTDEGMAVLQNMPNMNTLGLEGTLIGDGTMEYIGELEHLVNLNLAITAITDSGLANIASLNGLTNLELSNTAISDDGIPYLTDLENLQNLTLPWTISPEARKQIARWTEIGNKPFSVHGEAIKKKRIKVTDARSGRSIADAFLEVKKERGTGGYFYELYFWTNEQGEAVFWVDVDTGSTYITGYAVGYESKQAKWAWSEQEGFEIALERATQIGGFVVDEFDQPVPNAVVKIPVPGMRNHDREALDNHTELTAQDG